MKSVQYLNMLIAKHQLKNDLALSNFLGWPNSKISQYRTGKRIMDNEACLAIALKLEIDPLQIIMAADLDKAERAGQHSLWEVFSRRTTTAASVALLTGVVTLFMTPTPSEAAPLLKPDSGTVSIM